jgi:oligopeptide transport system permease protein
MWRFLLSRLLSAIPTLLAIVTLAFVLLRAAPGGPFDSEKELTPEVKASIEHAYHLDEPLPKQYLRYLGQLARGDLGPSFQYLDNSVNKYIAEGFPVDLRIGGLALLLACLIGIPLGARAAWRRGGVIDRLATAVSLVGVSIPVYVTAPLLILIFAVTLQWLPAGDWGAGSWRNLMLPVLALSSPYIAYVTAPLLILIFAVTLQWLPAGDWGAGSWRNLMLPVLALSSPYIAYVTRIMRGSFIEVLEQPYIRTARAKGLSTQDILFRHALRPALMPLAAFLGPAIVGAITGSIVVETTFGLPGIGRSFVDGAFNRDYTLVMGVTILYGVLIIFANLLADVCQAMLDPRIRLR